MHTTGWSTGWILKFEAGTDLIPELILSSFCVCTWVWGLQSSVQRDSPSSFESECKWWFLKITYFWPTSLASTDAFILLVRHRCVICLCMTVRQSILGIGLWCSVLRDSPSIFESECKWRFLKITNFDRLCWLLQMPLFQIHSTFGRGCTNQNRW